MTRVAIVGGGPGGYEAALVAAQLDADVTVVERDGLGGAAVLTDCVPSKTLVATATLMSEVKGSDELGLREASDVVADVGVVNNRVKKLADAQSVDVGRRLAAEGVRTIAGTARLDGDTTVFVESGDDHDRIEADVVLVATGARPRVLDTAQPDGERILTWQQVYELTELPERLVVVGSGVTGLEFAGAYLALGSEVVLVSSRERVLPGEDADAAKVIEDVYRRRGMTVLSTSRMASVERTADGVRVTLTDDSTVDGSHCLLALGSLPNTDDLGLDKAGVRLDERGFVEVDGVSRTAVRDVYAAGDCTGVQLLASVAAMQGRIAMWHALGDAVTPLDLAQVSSTVFTAPEIATVGWTQRAVDAGDVDAAAVTLDLAGNARAKMQGVRDGFVKLFCRPGTGIVVGGVVVAPQASELIHPVAVAVGCNLTVDQLAHAFTVYPAMTGSVAEAARRLHRRG
ncbi:MAG: NAD(P)H-quinone dehydrogenase [Actinomycetota bacterium]|nr:NAD(P)H-quinone dehydrogenase [Actinomycetota bacterium]